MSSHDDNVRKLSGGLPSAEKDIPRPCTSIENVPESASSRLHKQLLDSTPRKSTPDTQSVSLTAKTMSSPEEKELEVIGWLMPVQLHWTHYELKNR